MVFRSALQLAFALALAIGTVAEARPVTIRDAIEMTNLADPEPYQRQRLGEPVKVSPDGRRFMIVTRTGDIANNWNEYRLTVFDSAEAKRFVAAGGTRPRGVVAATFRSSSNRPGVGGARWLSDSRTIAFLGENPGEDPEAWAVQADGSGLRRLTDHPTPVLGFDVNLGSDQIVYSAMGPLGWTADERNGAVLGTMMLWEAIEKNRGSEAYEPVLFYAAAQGGKGQPVAMKPYQLNSDPWPMALSPDGRHAVALIHLEHSPDSWWKDYEPVAKNPYFGTGRDHSAFKSFATEHRQAFLQYVLIDTATGTMKPLLDAPAALFFGGMLVGAHWTDNQHVVLGNTFLPLKGATGDEMARRKAKPSVVEVDIRTGRFERVFDIEPTNLGKGAVSGSLMASVLTSDGGLVLLSMGQGGQTPRQLFRKRDGHWAEAKGEDIDAALGGRAGLVFDVAQDLNTAPDLRVTDPSTGKAALLTDLNPRLRELEMGTAETIEWTAPGGRKVQGGLLKPLNYRQGKRYPLLIQTHGYSGQTFWLEGPMNSPSGYPGRALAAHGIMVLQVPDVAPKAVSTEENLIMRGVYQAAIDELDRRGLIDRAKVGMHGWSRTGLYVQDAMVFSDLKLAAASVSDANSIGQLYYLMGFGSGYPGMMIEKEVAVGAPLWGEGVKTWVEKDPILHLDRVTAPIRIEAYGRTIGAWWDAYAILRRHGRPAEYVYYPDGDHVLKRPKERLMSQEGAVDWYRFWLKGEEDPDPAKTGRYKSWREMRSAATAVDKPSAR